MQQYYADTSLKGAFLLEQFSLLHREQVINSFSEGNITPETDGFSTLAIE